MGGRVDLTSWNVLYYSLSLFLSIYLSYLCLIWCLSLPGSPSNSPPPHPAPPPFVFSSLLSLFPHLHSSLFPLPLMSFFLSLLCLFLPLFDPSVKSVLGPASRSPCCYDRGLTAAWRWPMNSGSDLFSFSLLSAPALSLHTDSFLFISEHQFQQGSSTGRTWKGLSELGTCVKQQKKADMIHQRSTG